MNDLRSLPYEDYLKTSHWQIVRDAALYVARYQCQRCGERRVPLDVHHRTYERLGGELLADVVALCRRCHDEVHAAPRAFAELSIDMGLWLTEIVGAKADMEAIALTDDEIDAAVIAHNRRRFEAPSPIMQEYMDENDGYMKWRSLPVD